MSLTARITDDQPQQVFLDGSINETANLAEIFNKFKGEVVLDMSGIKKINSIGIRRWLPLISEYSQRHGVSIKSLPYSLVIQSQSILNLFGSARVLSFFAPYYCKKCDQDHLVELQKSDVEKSSYNAPVSKCPTCLTEMVFDEFPGYFNFLKHSSK